MPSFSIALTGLEANSIALNTIGNNLANLNTTAFKEQTTSFADLFYQTIGSSGANDKLQVGLGTRVSGTNTDYSNGSLATTTNSTDMALNGDGFFVEQQGGVQSLTRAGDFQLDLSGALISDSGESVMGYQAQGGAINTNSPLQALTIPVNAVQPAQATQNFGITANLNAGAALGDSFNSSLSVYDSLGTSHIATVTFTKSATNAWSYSIALPAGDATGTPANNTGTLTFGATGNLLTPTSNITGISFPRYGRWRDRSGDELEPAKLKWFVTDWTIGRGIRSHRQYPGRLCKRHPPKLWRGFGRYHLGVIQQWPNRTGRSGGDRNGHQSGGAVARGQQQLPDHGLLGNCEHRCGGNRWSRHS